MDDLKSWLALSETFAGSFGQALQVDKDIDHCLLNHVVERVLNGTAIDTPFPHAELALFFPTPVYEQALSEWPSDDNFKAVKVTEHTEYVGSRRACLMVDRPRFERAEICKGIWEDIAHVLGSPDVVYALSKRFSLPLGRQIDSLARNENDQPGFRMYLCQDEGISDALGAHVDAARKLLTIVVYLDLVGDEDEASATAWGTRLYDEEVTPRPLDFSSNGLYTARKTVNFERNKAFVMPNTPFSFHGVAGGQKSVIRKTIMCGYWLLGS